MGKRKGKWGFGRECEQVRQRAKHPESGTANVDSLDPVPGVIVIQRLPFGRTFSAKGRIVIPYCNHVLPIIKIGSNLAQVEDDRVRYSTQILQLVPKRSVLILHNEFYPTARSSPTIAGISCPPPLSPHTDTDHSALRHAEQHRQRASNYFVKEERRYSFL